MNTEIIAAAQGLSNILGNGPIARLDAGTLSGDEQGWSGAAVRRVAVQYESGAQSSMILKQADRKERCAMHALTTAGHAHTPAAFSPDLTTDAPCWMAQQDLGRPQPPSLEDPCWMAKAAGALAGIHAEFLGKGDAMPWLPHADEAYWRYIVTQISLDHFERKMEQSSAFNREFGHYLPGLRAKAEEFVRAMVALYREGDSLTLTHGDIQSIDGAHIYDCGGKPYIIDFGWCHYAPFYVDLASYFTFEDAKLYHSALAARGVELSYADFDERLRAVFPYSGFIYMCPSVINWQDGPTEQTGKRLLQMIHTIIYGEFPERRIHYSDALFQRLLRAAPAPLSAVANLI